MDQVDDTAAATARHATLRSTDEIIGHDASLDQYRATNARLKQTIVDRDAELTSVRAQLADTDAQLRAALARVAGTAAQLVETRDSLKVTANERDRLHKRVEQLLGSRSWRVGHALVTPLSRLSGHGR